MVDFLSFKSFISTEVLIIFYYMGAIILPVAAWFFMLWLVQKYKLIGGMYKSGKNAFWQALSSKQKMQLVMFFIVFLIIIELFWRMMFEFLIAYMQIRDALVQP
ncbi:MAG TPA: DUF4282 domain-containing protein [Leucothrix mucor]|nr:DUF4282 domain-containing protein [Leucothrix mucor]